jgi:putative glycosyltransferase (TIGR04372 family)
MAWSKKDRRVLLGVYLKILSHRFREGGYLWLLAGVVKRALTELAWLTLLPFALALHLLGYRRLFVHNEHIGHLAGDLDCFIKEQRLGLLPDRRWFALGAGSRITNQHIVANEHLLTYWRRHIPVVTAPLACAVLDIATKRYLARHDLSHYQARFFGTQDIYRVNRVWGDRPPILTLSAEDETWANDALADLRLPAGGWFVCVHVREGGFLPQNELVQSHRNATISNTIAALREIVRRGGTCVRMGDPSMQPLPAIDGVIDYAHHPRKSARLDIILCAKARFFLGCASGLSFVSTAFGIPVASANMIPVATLATRYYDISIPKLIWSNRLGRHLRFDEILSSDIGGYFFSHQYRQSDLRVDENSGDDILGLVQEMLDRLDGRSVETDEDIALQRSYKSLLRPGAYSYGAASRIGTAFLRRHAYLLEGRQTCRT